MAECKRSRRNRSDRDNVNASGEAAPDRTETVSAEFDKEGIDADRLRDFLVLSDIGPRGAKFRPANHGAEREADHEHPERDPVIGDRFGNRVAADDGLTQAVEPRRAAGDVQIGGDDTNDLAEARFSSLSS